MPMELLYLWQIFTRLRRRRGGNGYMPLPISWSDIGVYSRLNRISLAPWECEVLEEIDDRYLESVSKQLKAEKPKT